MQNFNLLEKNILQLPSGVFAGVESYACYPSGELEGVKLSEKNMLVTHIGELVPSYIETNRRKNKYSVEFYKNGMVKAIALNEVQEIQTPIGEFPAELVTFYETGELKRFFPLDGQISGIWSEQDEKALAIPLSFDLSFTSFTAIISGVAFYQSGNIRSVTLFPGETISIKTEFGEILTRNGFSLYESGKLESLEPAAPTLIKTPAGRLNAFDPNAVGIHADVNSLVFGEDGDVIAYNPARYGSLQMCSPEDCANCSLGCS
jgi:antitoxin component YwqK of YwqJK toxin-antitoxin module